MTTHAALISDPYGNARIVRLDHYPVARSEQPPVGPDRETDEEFQRRIDALVNYRTPLWRDVAFMVAVIGLFTMVAIAGLWAVAP